MDPMVVSQEVIGSIGRLNFIKLAGLSWGYSNEFTSVGIYALFHYDDAYIYMYIYTVSKLLYISIICI